MKDKILSFIQGCVKDQAIELQPSSVLEGLIDSITFVKMIVALEEEFNFEFEDNMLSLSKIVKVEDMVNYVESRLE